MLAAHELHRQGLGNTTPATEPEPEQAPTATATENTKTGPTIECPICSDDTHDFATLTCGHQLCHGCLNNMLDLAIHAKNSQNLHCPNPQCKNHEGASTPLTIDDIQKFATPRKVAAFEEIITNEALAGLGIKHCPTPGCPNQFEVENDQPMSRRCDFCSRRYCVQCLIQHPERVSCAAARAMKNMPEAERATEEWKRANTKQCPHCHANIERSEGCNHMTCRKCNYEFCWLCMIRWPGYERHACPTFGGEAPAKVNTHPAPDAFDPDQLGAELFDDININH